jgi:hypothetical protein
MIILDIHTWSREDVPDLEQIDEDVGILRGWIVTSWLKA